MVNVRAGSSITELEHDIKKLEDKIYVAKTSLPHWEDELRNMKKEYEESKWMKTEHPKQVGVVYVSSNYGAWEEVKELYPNDPIYIQVTQEYGSGALSIEEAKGLIEYLQHKIDYLEVE